jgi:succinoglycan biosynthesis protein ExoL
MDASIDERAPVDLTSDTNLTSDAIRTPTVAVRELVYFGSEVRDASTIKRVQQFIDHGFAVTVFGFHRTRYNNDYRPPWPHVTMGTTIDGRYGHRLLALLSAIPTLLAHRRRFATAAVFYARNIDQLLLAMLARLLAGSRAPVVYEVLDIPPILMRKGLSAALLRWIERRCLDRVRLLALSSPAFHRNYYAAVQHHRGPWFLVENKLHPSIARLTRPARRGPVRGGRPWVVGYFGLIRGEGTFALMARLAERLRGRVQFVFRGALTTVDTTRFRDTLKRLPNMTFGGPYQPHSDLETLYREVDFAWALDLEHTDHNSRWLMPCRFYESGYFGVPCLAVRDFQVGQVVEQHGIGFTFGQPLEEQLVRFFETLTVADYECISSELARMPDDTFVAGDDVVRLCRLIDGFSGPRSTG